MDKAKAVKAVYTPPLKPVDIFKAIALVETQGFQAKTIKINPATKDDFMAWDRNVVGWKAADDRAKTGKMAKFGELQIVEDESIPVGAFTIR